MTESHRVLQPMKTAVGGDAAGVAFRGESAARGAARHAPLKLSHPLLTCQKFSVVVSRIQANSDYFMGDRISMADRALGRFLPNPKLRLKEQFHEVCRFKHLAVRSEEAYWAWVVRLVRFFDSKIDPRGMSGGQLAEFLSHLARVDGVAASTQNQALSPREITDYVNLLLRVCFALN
jgi:hypothetical protein